MARKEKDPLGPLETIVSFLVFLFVAGVILGIAIVALGDGSVATSEVGPHEVCVSSSPGKGLPWGGDGRQGDRPIGLRAGVRWNTTAFEMCDESPSTAAVALGYSRTLIAPITSIGGLLLLWRVIRRARRDGIFADTIPRALSQLAGFLLVWSLFGWAWRTFTDNVLLRRMAEHTFTMGPSGPPITTVIIGLGLISLARVMTHAVAMREDVEATV